MKLDIYSNEKKIGVCAYVKCVRPTTAVRRLRKAVETSDKLPNKDRKLLLQLLGDERRFLKVLNLHKRANGINREWAIDLTEEDKGLWFISVYIRKNIKQ